MKKYKMKKKSKLIINGAVITTLLIGGYSLKGNYNDSTFAIREFNNVLNTLNMSDENDKLFETINSYENFNNVNNDYECNQDYLDYYMTTPETLANNIVDTTKNSQLAKDCKVIDELYVDTIASAIENSWKNCPQEKKDSFFHLLQELKIVESSYTSESDNELISGEYEKETNTIKIYINNIYNAVEWIYQYRDVDEETIDVEVDNTINGTIAHEMNHVMQDTCSCDKSENKICLNNKTLWEADAEIYNIYPTVYNEERDLYNLTRDIALFDKDLTIDSFHEILVNNDLKGMYNFFDAKTKEEKYDVYRLFSILNIYPNIALTTAGKQAITEDLYIQLLKYYCKNLVVFINENNIAMEDAIYFFKGYLNELLSLKKNTSPTLEIIDKIEIIVTAFEEYLANIYSTDIENVSKKMLSIDIYHEELDENGYVIDTKGHVPKSTLKVLSDQKINYISNEYEINGSFLEPVFSENYLEACNFKEANSLLKLLNQQQNLTYKKEK